ncbi:hypothetical protein [Dulcicalothrix desertica]|nr:hypothetical protein [Dulcicalothrix desertica]
MEAHRLLQTNFLALRFLTNFGLFSPSYLVVDGRQSYYWLAQPVVPKIRI